MLVMIAGACTNMENKKQKTIDVYYDINGLIDRQVKLLSSVSPSLLKTANLDGNQETDTLKLSQEEWENELSIFRSMDINKPMLVDSYTEQVKKYDAEIVTTWISKSPSNTEVDTLIIYQSVKTSPNRIEAYLSSKNTLFKSSKRLELIFLAEKGGPLLEQYSVSGWQKMLSKDSTYFSVNARIKP